MRQNLKSRLMRIRDAAKDASVSPVIPQKSAVSKNDNSCPEKVFWPGWVEAGFKTLKREISTGLSFPIQEAFPKALAILVPDILRMGRIPLPGELLFFDLETTGLSGGAGTLAFLAAFGRIRRSMKTDGNPGEGDGKSRMEITQYLLLDYGGEGDFIERVIAELSPKDFPSAAPPVVVSYNGKCFDSQILKTRCLMNGIAPPAFFHADLLHPARRLWKKTLPDCSQAAVEVSVLGLDRTGDVSGALAPEIWFSFLRTGENRDLFSVCDHNVKDVTGLASIFLALAEIAANPLGPGTEGSSFRFDEEALALYWHKTLKKNPLFFDDGESYRKCVKTGELLLETAARNGHPRAAIVLAINAEWRLKNPALALSYTEAALAAPEISGILRDELEKRRHRLLGKL